MLQIRCYQRDTFATAHCQDCMNGQLSVGSNSAEFVVEPGERTIGIGAYTASELRLQTDNTDRITISAEGNIKLGNQGASEPPGKTAPITRIHWYVSGVPSLHHQPATTTANDTHNKCWMSQGQANIDSKKKGRWRQEQ